MESSAFPERRAGEGLICVAEVRIAMIPGFTSPGCAIDMLIQFRESCFQMRLVKIPSNNECSLRMYGFQFAKSQIKFVQGHRCVCLGGNIYSCDYNRRELPW